MKNAFDRTIWTVIAAALTLIALNPWIAPGSVNAKPEILKVDLVKVSGLKFPRSSSGFARIPVYVDNIVTVRK